MSATESTKSAETAPGKPARRRFGVGAVLITVYAILAVGATSRAGFQLVAYFGANPAARLPIVLSAVSAVIYVLATIALIAPGRAWYRVAWTTISFELAGVLIIGTLSYVFPAVFVGPASVPDVAHGTVWSGFGEGYLYIPVVLPILGMIWLARRGRRTHGVD
jgi:hypothetical protein